MRSAVSFALVGSVFSFGVKRRTSSDFGFDDTLATAPCKTCKIPTYRSNPAVDAIGGIGGQANFDGSFDDYLNLVNVELNRVDEGQYTNRRHLSFENGECTVATATPANVGSVPGPDKATKAFVFTCTFDLDYAQIDDVFELYGDEGTFSRELDPTYIEGEQTCYFKDGLDLPDFTGNLCRTRFQTSPLTGDRELFFLSGNKQIVTQDETCTVFGIPSVRPSRGNWIDTNLKIKVGPGTTYEWCKDDFWCVNIPTANNLFPSGDRVCVSNSQTSSGLNRVKIQHIIASFIGGGIDTSFDPNNPGSSDLASNGQIDAYSTEATRLHSYLFH